MIGGLGPESTLDYYQRIIALFRERTGDRHYPEFLIVSVDLRKGLDFMDANDLNGMANYLLEGVDKLALAGADFGISPQTRLTLCSMKLRRNHRFHSSALSR